MRVKRPILPTLFWVGFDLAKLTLLVALSGDQELGEMTVRTFNRTRKAMKGLLDWLRAMAPEGMPIGIVMEATGTFADEVGGWLLDLDPGLVVAIVNPGQTSAFIRSLGLRNKTDDLDGRALAKYGYERRPMAWERPTPEMAALKDLVRARTSLVNTRMAMTMRLKDHERAAKAAGQALRKVIKALESQIEALDKAIQAHVAGHPDLSWKVKRLCSIKGVALVTATTVLVELGDLRRFARSRQLTAFAGLSPKKKQSGTSINGRTRMCKQGSPRVRAALYMAAGAAARFNPDLKAVYLDLQAKGKTKRSALGAVMRKLLVLMRAVLKADHDWLPMSAVA
jgi:transposase